MARPWLRDVARCFYFHLAGVCMRVFSWTEGKGESLAAAQVSIIQAYGRGWIHQGQVQRMSWQCAWPS